MSENDDSQILDTVKHNDGDSIQQIVGLTLQAMRPAWKSRPGGDHRHDLFDLDGDCVKTIVPPRSYVAFSVQGMIDQLMDLASICDEETSAGKVCRVFVGRGSVTAILDERGDRNDQISMRLDVCGSLSLIKSGIKDKGQRDLDWILRSKFQGRFSPETFLPSVRSLKWISSNSGRSEVQHGNETVDLSIKAELEGLGGGFAEEVTLQTSVFEQLACLPDPPLFPIKCAVKINVQDRVFSVEPLEGEIAKTYGDALAFIKAQFDKSDLGENVKVFQDSGC